MKYPTLFELLKSDPLSIYNVQKEKYPAIAEKLYDHYLIIILLVN